MGYWPSVRSRWLDIGQVLFFFFCVLWTETESRSINTQKRKRAISNHLDRTNLGSPEGQDSPILARPSSQSLCRIWFILPAHEASHIIMMHISPDNVRSKRYYFGSLFFSSVFYLIWAFGFCLFVCFFRLIVLWEYNWCTFICPRHKGIAVLISRLVQTTILTRCLHRD